MCAVRCGNVTNYSAMTSCCRCTSNITTLSTPREIGEMKNVKVNGFLFIDFHCSPTVKDLASHRTLKETEPGPPPVAAGVLAADIKPAPESEPSPPISNHHDEEFKIPEGKQSVKTDTSLVETLAESVTDHNVDDGADTDGGVTDPAAGESGDTVMENVGEADTEPLQDTPKPSKSRPRRLRADSMLSLGSDTALATPPPSPADSAPLTSPLTYKMSKKRAQQLRSTPSTPPGELKVKKIHIATFLDVFLK